MRKIRLCRALAVAAPIAVTALASLGHPEAAGWLGVIAAVVIVWHARR